MAWILDLDGVVWLADVPIAGSAAAIAALRAKGEHILFVTNNSSLTVGEYVAKLARSGVPMAADELCTSAQAAALLVEPGETVLVCAGPGVVEALGDRGARCVRHPGDAAHIDAVVVGWHRDFDYGRLDAAFQALRRGARFIATNDDATYPTPDGPVPGGGAIVAAVATASGRTPQFAGKPYPPVAALVRARLGLPAASAGPGGAGVAAAAHLATPDPDLVLVGDRASTDGGMARAIGARFALVLSGVTAAADLPVSPAPDLVAADLATLVSELSGS